MNALVTGATGFLGYHLCRRLNDDGCKITILRRAKSNADALSKLKTVEVIGDITDREAVRKAVAGNDAVFHAAAHLSYWNAERQIQNETNIRGTKNVVEACLESGVRKLVHVSSTAAVGIPPNSRIPADENFGFNLENLSLNYHVSKKRAEEIVADGAAKGLNAVIVNPASMWGRFGEKFRGAEIVQKALRSRIVPYFTGGICVVRVEDAVEGIMAALAQGRTGERYILGGENLTFKAIVKAVARRRNLKRLFVPVPPAATWLSAAVTETAALVTRRRPKITFVTHYGASRFNYYDSSKAKNELGYSPENFETILDECLTFLERRGI